MTDNQFDNFFREKLKDHTVPIPEGLWEKIRPEKEKRPKGFLIPRINGTGLMVAALLAGILIVGLLTYQNKSKDLSVEKNNSQATQSAKIKSENNSNLKENKSEINSTPTDIDHKNATPSKQENADKENAKEPEQLINNTTVLRQNKPTGVLINKPEFDQAAPATVETPAFTKTTAGEAVPAAGTNPTGEQADEFAVIANLSQASPVYLNHYAPEAGLEMVNKQLASNAHDKRIKSTIIICPTTTRSRSNLNSDWAFEVFGSPDYALKSVSNISASQQYLDKKDSSERMQVSYTAGFRLVKPLNDNLLLKAGFQYSQMNQKFTYRNENEIKTTTVITNRTIIRAPGDTIIVSDTSTLRQVGYSVKTIHNHFRSIDIPVTLGYQFGNEDLSLGINAGVIFNLSSWYQGEILDSSYASVPINKVSNAIYKTNIGMGLYSSISILKKINDNTHLFFEPYFRYNLSNMTNSQSSYNQRFHVGGLAIGLRFNLNR